MGRCLYSVVCVANSLGAMGASTDTLRQTRISSALLGNRPIAKHQSAALHLQRLPIKHSVAKTITANNTLPWTNSTKANAVSNSSATSLTPRQADYVEENRKKQKRENHQQRQRD